MPTYLDSLYAKRAELTDAANALLDAAATETRSLNEDERQRVSGYEVECRKIDDEIVDLERVNESAAKFQSMLGKRQEVAEVRDRAASRTASETTEDTTVPEPVDRRSAGEKFVSSEAFLNYRGRGSSEAVEFKDFLGLETRDAIKTGDMVGGTYEFGGRVGYLSTTPLLDIVGREVVTSNSVTYMDWGTTNPAATVVEEGELKPEATLAPEEVPLALKTYAHWKGITRQALEDFPRVRSIVEGKLRQGLANALQTAAATALTDASGDIPAATGGTDLLTGIRAGIAKVQEAGFAPRTVLLNPADYASLDISASSGANAGPVAFAQFWGLTPVASSAVASGTAYVGDFAQGVTWFDRGVSAVYLTDSHADYFIRNLMVILAETRGAFAVTDALALAKVTAGGARTAAATSTK
jgi:HK97 family phage major capsid protein